MNLKLASIIFSIIVILNSATGLCAGNEFQLGAALEIPEPRVSPRAPETRKPLSQAGLSVDTGNRSEVADFFDSVYRASEGIDANWTGNVDNCTPGTTSQEYEDATLLRVNFYRAMAGLNADITFSDTFDSQCQQAALIMIAQGSLSHNPPDTWSCWTQEGTTAASNSNIALGSHGPASIDGYMEDPGAGNIRVGHRNWILFPLQRVMGSGSTTARNGFFRGSNVLWVIDSTSWAARPAIPQGIAWPPEGYVPYQVVFPRWSFSFYRADFTAATVIMTQGGNPINLNIVFANSGTGTLPDNIIVWEPENLPSSAPAEDLTYTVTISNVLIDESPQEFTYDVTIIDPDRIVQEPTPTPTLQPEITFLNLFDMSVNWHAEEYSGLADTNMDNRVSEEDIFRAIEEW